MNQIKPAEADGHITLCRADGTEVEATVIIGDRQCDPDYGDWFNCRVLVDGTTFGVGGADIHSAESALAENRQYGLQTDTHPEMHWPGAVYAGDPEYYDIGCQVRDGVVMVANFDTCGEMEALMEHLGYSMHDTDVTADAWEDAAAEISAAVEALVDDALARERAEAEERAKAEAEERARPVVKAQWIEDESRYFVDPSYCDCDCGTTGWVSEDGDYWWQNDDAAGEPEGDFAAATIVFVGGPRDGQEVC